jgi:WD40 repeat protein
LIGVLAGAIVAVAFLLIAIVRNSNPPEILTRPTGTVQSLAYSPDGQMLAVGTEHEGTEIWDIAGKRRLHTFGANRTNSAAFSPDGQLLATVQVSAGGSASVQLWQVSDGTLLKTWKGAEPLLFSPDGQTLAMQGTTGEIQLVRIADGAIVQSLLTQGLYSLSFAPDGQTLAVGQSLYAVQLWHIADGTRRQTLKADGRSVAFAPDGEILATISEDHDRVQLWQADTGTPLRTLVPAWGPIQTLAFTPDGADLAALTTANTLEVWQVDDGKHLQTRAISAPGGYELSCLTMAPDGRSLAIGAKGRVLLLDRDTP